MTKITSRTLTDEWNWTRLLLANFLLHLVVYVLTGLISSKYFKAYKKAKEKGDTRTLVEWRARADSMLHCCLITPISFLMLAFEKSLSGTVKSRLYGSTPLASAIYCFTASYFLLDLLLCICHHKIYGWQYIIHGFCSVLLYSAAVLVPYLQYYGFCFLLFEASTPFLNLTWYLKRFGYSDTSKQQVVTRALFAITFLIVRCMLGPYFSYFVWQDLLTTRHMPAFVRALYLAANITMNGLNFIWGRLILKKLLDAVGKKN